VRGGENETKEGVKCVRVGRTLIRKLRVCIFKKYAFFSSLVSLN